MTLLLDFSENSNKQQLLGLGKWLKEMGIVKDFKIAPISFDEAGIGDSSTDTFLQNMLKEAEEDFENGQVYSSGEAKNQVEKWLMERK